MICLISVSLVERKNHDIKLIRATSGFASDIGTSMAHDYEMSKYVSGNTFIAKYEGDHKKIFEYQLRRYFK